MRMRQGQIEIEHAASETLRTATLEPEGDHHLQFMGKIEGHTSMAELGQHEIHVYRQHHVTGPYCVELEVTAVPAFEDSTARIHAFLFDVANDGTRGAPVGRLNVAMAVHTPDLTDTHLDDAELRAQRRGG